MADGQDSNSVSENALANQQVNRSKTYGGTTGNSYNLMSGDYISKLEFYAGQIFSPQAIVVRFNNGLATTIGTMPQTPVSTTTVDLSNDSIARLFVSVVSKTGYGSGTGVGGVYIETTHGRVYSTLGSSTPLTVPTAWTPVVTATNETLTNIVLVGIAGYAGTAIDALSFLYKQDTLMSHGITGVTYGQFTVGIPTPLNVASATVSNLTGQPQQMSITFSESVSSTYNFSTTAGATAGLTTTVEAGLPFVAKGEVEVSATVSIEVTMGVSKSLTDTFAYEAAVNVGPNETIQANAIASTYTINADYTANFSEVWVHAGAVTRQVNGSLRGVSAYDVSVSYQNVS